MANGLQQQIEGKCGTDLDFESEDHVSGAYRQNSGGPNG